jgi:glycine/D-amino acid oxidase-like deaminating enzyme
MPTRYGRSPWIDQFPPSRVPSYPKHRGPLTVDVAVIGGGLTGAATAYAASAAGLKVAVFERDRVGRGTSAFSSGWVADEPGISFIDLEKLLGLRAARHTFQSWRRAALDFAALLRRLDVKVHLAAHPTLIAALTPEQATLLKREQKARRDAGLDAPLLNARALAEETALTGLAAIRTKDGASIDPYRATLALLDAAAERGAKIFEGSPLLETTFTRKTVDAHMAGGKVRAGKVVVTTSAPTQTFRSLQRHFWTKAAFAAITEPIPAKIRHTLGDRDAVVRDRGQPSHTIRWVNDEQLMVMGADSDAPPARLEAKTIVQRTGQLMYELSTLYPEISGIMPAYGWASPYGLSAEGVPYIGPHRNFPFHLFAFGDSGHGVTGAYLASRILLRHLVDDVDSADEVFRFRR